MIITVLQENLLPKLQDALKFVSSKPQLPILSGVYFSCEEKHLIIRSTDLKVGFQAIIGGKVEKEGACVVPIRFLVELVASLHAGPMTLTFEETSLKISQGKVHSSLSTFPVLDFPPFPGVGTQACSIDSKIFSKAIDHVFYAASLDETRPVISSILIQLNEEESVIAATDGYRLAVEKIETMKVEDSQQILIQAKMLAEIARIIGKSSASEVKISISQELAQVSFQIEDTTMMVRLTEGKFPNFNAIIPPNFAISTFIEREPLIHALKTALVVAKESSSIISMEIGSSTIKVLGISQNIGENTSEIESTYAGDEKKMISCNAKFLMDCLSRIDSEFIELAMNEELKPIRIRAKEDEKFTYIVMPFKK